MKKKTSKYYLVVNSKGFTQGAFPLNNRKAAKIYKDKLELQQAEKFRIVKK